MSLMKRISLIFRSKANKALDRAEDPRETLDYSYQRQVELLSKVRRGVADVATSRKRVELQVAQLEQQEAKLTDQAKKALSMGREDLAREALTRKSGLTGQISDLKAQQAQLQGEEEKLTLASQRLQAKVEAFRTKKETIKATYTAAEAQTRINEAFSGISEEMGDVGLAVQRAEDKTQALQARAGAIDELLASGALDDVSGTAKDDLTVELERLSSEGDVEQRKTANLNAVLADWILFRNGNLKPSPQSDGSSIAITYELISGQYRVKTYTDGEGRLTTFNYGQPTGNVSGGGVPVNQAADSAVLQTSRTTTHALNTSAYTVPNGSWAAAMLLETDHTAAAAMPRMVFDGAGNGFALWVQGSDVMVRRYTAATATWSAAEVLDSSPQTAGTAMLAVDRASGSAVLARSPRGGARRGSRPRSRGAAGLLRSVR